MNEVLSTVRELPGNFLCEVHRGVGCTAEAGVLIRQMSDGWAGQAATLSAASPEDNAVCHFRALPVLIGVKGRLHQECVGHSAHSRPGNTKQP